MRLLLLVPVPFLAWATLWLLIVNIKTFPSDSASWYEALRVLGFLATFLIGFVGCILLVAYAGGASA